MVAVFPTSDLRLPTSVSSSFPIQRSMLDVRPARNAFVQILCSAYNVDVSAAIIILTLSTLHGRRMFDVHLFSASSVWRTFLPRLSGEKGFSIKFISCLKIP